MTNLEPAVTVSQQRGVCLCDTGTCQATRVSGTLYRVLTLWRCSETFLPYRNSSIAGHGIVRLWSVVSLICSPFIPALIGMRLVYSRVGRNAVVSWSSPVTLIVTSPSLQQNSNDGCLTKATSVGRSESLILSIEPKRDKKPCSPV